MKNGGDQWDQKTILHELIQGRELVKQLRSHLDKSSSIGEVLLDKILSSFDKVISMSKTNKPLSDRQSVGQSESPRSKSGSPRSDPDSDNNEVFKRRKTLPTWTKKVDVASTNNTGTEGVLDDGYSWRKYGQKEIQGAAHPRSYYRCTHQYTLGCLARKHVQRSTNNPSIVDITYRGKHTCLQISSNSPSSQLLYNQNQNQYPQGQQKLKQSEEVLLLDFEKGLQIKTDGLNVSSTQESSSSFSFPFTSAAATEYIKIETQTIMSPEEPYLVTSFNGHTNNIGNAAHFNNSEDGHPTADNIASMNSPITNFDFGLEQTDFDLNFWFDY